MPELPEVETIKRDLIKCLLGKTIKSVFVNDTMVVRQPDPKLFVKRLIGKTIVDIRRRGKAVIFELNNGDFLVVQLIMTGQLIYGKKLKTSRVIFELSDNKYLNYNDQRRFGRLSAVGDLNQIKFFQTLGIEPLSREFHYDWLYRELSKRKTPIKSLLMNQNFVAGIGNIYASEILFRCGINPKRPARTLKPKEIRLLHTTTVEVLNEAIRLRGSSVNTYRDVNGQKGRFLNRIRVYGKENEECAICKTPITRIVLSGRSTFFCKRCQS